MQLGDDAIRCLQTSSVLNAGDYVQKLKQLATEPEKRPAKYTSDDYVKTPLFRYQHTTESICGDLDLFQVTMQNARAVYTELGTVALLFAKLREDSPWIETHELENMSLELNQKSEQIDELKNKLMEAIQLCCAEASALEKQELETITLMEKLQNTAAQHNSLQPQDYNIEEIENMLQKTNNQNNLFCSKIMEFNQKQNCLDEELMELEQKNLQICSLLSEAEQEEKNLHFQLHEQKKEYLERDRVMQVLSIMKSEFQKNIYNIGGIQEITLNRDSVIVTINVGNEFKLQITSEGIFVDGRHYSVSVPHVVKFETRLLKWLEACKKYGLELTGRMIEIQTKKNVAKLHLNQKGFVSHLTLESERPRIQCFVDQIISKLNDPESLIQTINEI